MAPGLLSFFCTALFSPEDHLSLSTNVLHSALSQNVSSFEAEGFETYRPRIASTILTAARCPSSPSRSRSLSSDSPSPSHSLARSATSSLRCQDGFGTYTRAVLLYAFSFGWAFDRRERKKKKKAMKNRRAQHSLSVLSGDCDCAPTCSTVYARSTRTPRNSSEPPLEARAPPGGTRASSPAFSSYDAPANPLAAAPERFFCLGHQELSWRTKSPSQLLLLSD
mgnify:FL=1|jgi:hypothetical protein